MARSGLPHYAAGEIIKGFGRGSKQLGIPTANFAIDVVKSLPSNIDTGIYFGLAHVEQRIYKMVMSIGWNPYYKNQEKSMETHILHTFDHDLYGEMLKVIILGYIRPEKNFNNLEELITAINGDIRQADELLNNTEFQHFYKDSFFVNDKT